METTENIHVIAISVMVVFVWTVTMDNTLDYNVYMSCSNLVNLFHDR